MNITPKLKQFKDPNSVPIFSWPDWVPWKKTVPLMKFKEKPTGIGEQKNLREMTFALSSSEELFFCALPFCLARSFFGGS